MKNNIRNRKDLAEEIRNVRLKKEVKRQKLIADVRVLQHKISSVEAGFQVARDIVNIFKNVNNNQMPPGEKIKNIFINSLIDIANDYFSKQSNKDSEEERETQD